jgi:D-hydantoinase
MKTSMVDTVIKNGKIVTPYHIYEAGIAIENGKIIAIAKSSSLPKAEKTIDAKGNFILPGVIDTHSHVYDPDYTYREDFITGTTAAAAGGVTTLIDMPLKKPVLSELIKKKIKIAEKNSLIDFSFHSGMILKENMNEISEVVKLGVKSFKVFTCAPFKVEDEILVQIMKSVLDYNGVVYVHAEMDYIVSQLTSKLKEEGRKDSMAYIASRPAVAEYVAINKVIMLAKRIGVHIHIAHLTTKRGVKFLEKAKASGQKVTAETCPHYLLFTKKDIRKLGPYLKMTPPLRSKNDAVFLWHGLRSGAVDTVASDHAPGTREEKEVGWRDIWQAWAGIPGVETLLPLMVSYGVNKGMISLQDLCRILCEKPAKIFHLYPRKGTLLLGSDADIVVIDLKRETVINADKLHYKVGWTPYEGMNLKGYPVLTMVRGEVVASLGAIIGHPGHGKFIPMLS